MTEKGPGAASMEQGGGGAVGRSERNAAPQHKQQFRQLAESLPQLVWTAAPDGTISYTNSRYIEFQGLIRLEDGSWDWDSSVHSEDRDRTVTVWREALRTGKPYQIEHRLQRSDGSYRWYLSRAVPIRDAQDHIVRWYGTTTDIHEQKETERALRESEEKYRAMFQLSTVGQAELELSTGRYLSVNARFCEITGYDESELLQMTFEEITHPDDLEDDRERFGRLTDGVQEEYESEKRYVRKDGEIRWVSARARLIRDADGKPVRSLGSAVDITERRAVEAERERLMQALAHERAQLSQLNETLERRVERRTEELQRANEELKGARDVFYTLFHASPIPIAIARMPDGVIVDVNNVYLSYLGWEREKVVGKTSDQLFLLADSSSREHIRRELSENGHVRNLEVPLRHPSGGLRTVLVSVERVELEGQASAITTLVDITERVKTESKVRRLASELVIAEQRERERIAQVLHDDVQQMLYSAQLNLHVLSQPDESFTEDTLRAELARIEDLVTSVIDATRSLSAQLQSPAVQQEELVASFQWLAHVMADQYGLQVQIETEGDCRIGEVARRELVVRAVRELLFNVVKHAGVESARLRAARRNDRLTVEVVDEGTGFDADAVAAGQDGRTGLGIGTIRERLHLFGGEFLLESQPGRGTRARIELPLHPQ